MWWRDYNYQDTRRHMRYASGGGWWATDEKPLPRRFTEGPQLTGDELMEAWKAVVKAARERAAKGEL